jgi:hypothetical protein
MNVVCTVCGKQFYLCNALIKRGRHRCSQQCVNAFNASDERFWGFVDKTGGPDSCWVWTGNKNKAGYGMICKEYAHRRSARMAEILTDESRYVCHKCDNPSCVNPAHLFQGTAKDNVADMISKQRKPRGESSPSAKLTEKDVIAIRESTGVQREIAERYGITQPAVSNIKARRAWAHIA